MFNIILYEPEIPPNTGNIIRLSANTGMQLHLIHPLGFTLQDKQLRRAGLDYSEYARIREHASLQDCLDSLGNTRLFAFTTKASRHYTDVDFIANDSFLFGPETRGLPATLLDSLTTEQKLRLPMLADSRSLNLSNTVAVVCYEAWRQQGFTGSR